MSGPHPQRGLTHLDAAPRASHMPVQIALHSDRGRIARVLWVVTCLCFRECPDNPLGGCERNARRSDAFPKVIDDDLNTIVFICVRVLFPYANTAMGGPEVNADRGHHVNVVANRCGKSISFNAVLAVCLKRSSFDAIFRKRFLE